MINVLLKNRIIYICLILFFSCKDSKKEDLIIKNVSVANSLKKIESNKRPLSFYIEYSNFYDIKIPYDSINWEEIETDSLITIKLSFKKVLKKDYIIKTRLIATNIPFIFKIKKEKNKDITFMIIQQHNTVLSDSLVFKLENKKYFFDKAFSTQYTHQDIDFICKLEVKQKDSLIELIDVGTECFERKR
jgi:hypothetical protein